MNAFLDNPVYNALSGGDAHLGFCAGKAKYFDEEVSPFAGFPVDYAQGFDDLYQHLPTGRKILYASRKLVDVPATWEVVHFVKGLQFVFTEKLTSTPNQLPIIPLGPQHVDQMIALARLTKPGPFDKRTIEFGHYHGIFEGERLVAMTGQRLHVDHFTEISAVCTHPDWLGKGFAAALIQKLLGIICKDKQTPFLHVRDDNARAIALYERLGFTKNGIMNFYFLKRK